MSEQITVIVESLSPRTRAVLGALRRGFAEKEIALMFRMSRHTVHTYVKRIYNALGVNSKARLIALLLESLEVSRLSQLDLDVEDASRALEPIEVASPMHSVQLRLPEALVAKIRREHGNVERFLVTFLQKKLSDMTDGHW